MNPIIAHRKTDIQTKFWTIIKLNKHFLIDQGDKHTNNYLTKDEFESINYLLAHTSLMVT